MPHSRVELAAFDFIDKVSAAPSVDTVYDLLATDLQKFGFTDFLITDMPPPSFGLENHLILNGWSPQWTERYIEQGFYAHDPMAKKTRERLDPFFWHEFDNTEDRSSKAQQVMDEAPEMMKTRTSSSSLVLIEIRIREFGVRSRSAANPSYGGLSTLRLHLAWQARGVASNRASHKTVLLGRHSLMIIRSALGC